MYKKKKEREIENSLIVRILYFSRSLKCTIMDQRNSKKKMALAYVNNDPEFSAIENVKNLYIIKQMLSPFSCPFLKKKVGLLSNTR